MDIDKIFQTLAEFGVTYGLRIVGALVILIIGWMVAGWASSAVEKSAKRSGKLDPTLTHFVARLVYAGVLIFTVVAVLNKFGVETTSIVGVLAAASLAVGMALQGTLSNFAAGVMLLLFRPYGVGDVVTVAGETGAVVELGTFATELSPLSGEFVLIPNGAIWGDTIKNFTRNKVRRLRIPVGIAYSDDHRKAREVLLGIAKESDLVLEEPATDVVMTELGDSSVNLQLRVWVDGPDYHTAQAALLETVKEAFDNEGLNFPFPQRDVHVFNEQA